VLLVYVALAGAEPAGRTFALNSGTASLPTRTPGLCWGNVSGWFRSMVIGRTYTIVVLTASSASRLGVEPAGAAGGHLVGDGLDVVVGGRHGYCE
jgi:hypothetical protein